MTNVAYNNFDIFEFTDASSTSLTTLQRVCGSRYNAFVTPRERSEESCRFFQIAAVRASVRQRVAETSHDTDEFERWDGMA